MHATRPRHWPNKPVRAASGNMGGVMLSDSFSSPHSMGTPNTFPLVFIEDRCSLFPDRAYLLALFTILSSSLTSKGIPPTWPFCYRESSLPSLSESPLHEISPPPYFAFYIYRQRRMSEVKHIYLRQTIMARKSTENLRVFH